MFAGFNLLIAGQSHYDSHSLMTMSYLRTLGSNSNFFSTSQTIRTIIDSNPFIILQNPNKCPHLIITGSGTVSLQHLLNIIIFTFTDVSDVFKLKAQDLVKITHASFSNQKQKSITSRKVTLSLKQRALFYFETCWRQKVDVAKVALTWRFIELLALNQTL